MAKNNTTETEDGWVPNKTFPSRPQAVVLGTPMDASLAFGISRRHTVHFYGDHGIGKTSRIVEYFDNVRLADLLSPTQLADLTAKVTVRDKGVKVVYVNLANITPDDKLMIAPVRGEDGQLALRQLLMEDLTPGEAFVIVLDDGRQADRKVQNQFMQLMNSWTIGHREELEGLVGIVALDNEGTSEGIRTSEDLAVADRKVTIRLSANDTGWRYALAAKYQDTDLNEVFAIWDSLGSDLRHTLSPRALDHVLYCTLNGMPPLWGLPLVGDNRQRLVVTTTDNKTVDRTTEILQKIAAAVHRPYVEQIPDAMRTVLRHAFRDRLAVLFQGQPGIGKTELTKEEIAEADLRCIYYSMPFTDPEQLVAPMPTGDGGLKALLTEELTNPDPSVIVWDEYNRPASAAAFAKLMEITQQWSLAGHQLDGVRAQVALCNPSEWLGRRMQVAKGNIAQGDRFTISVQLSPDDIPANEWLLTKWPDTVSGGDPDARERARSVIETVVEWHKNDLDDTQRQWTTKRTLVRLAELHLSGLPLEFGKIYLGEGEYAPVPLLDLEARLANRPMARLKEIAMEADLWEKRLREASETSTVGTNDVDQVFQAMSLAELSQLREHFDLLVRLVPLLPPKLKITFAVGVSEQVQKFWIEVFGAIHAKSTATK